MSLEFYTPTAEDIAKHYSACIDSVNLINAVIADPAAYAEDETVLQRNVEHLEGMLKATFWTDEDMTPIEAAIAAGNSAMTV